MAKSDAEVALEMFQSVKQSSDNHKRLKSATFWRLFNILSRKKTVVNRISNLLDEQGLKVSVKSGEPLGEESDSDWVVLTLKLHPPPPPPVSPGTVDQPPSEWLEMMISSSFESEREVESFFVVPLLEKWLFAD